MMHLTETEKKKLIDPVEKGKPLPSVYKDKHFAREDGTFIQATKEYRLVYKGKARREDIIAGTQEAPFQLVRQFNEDNKFSDGWRNMLIFGDNLPALKELYADQRGSNRYGTRDRIKLIYIDPPFATKQDFLKDKEKAYRDKVIGAQFIEFLRKRIVLLREVMAEDGFLFVHLDSKKVHYIKAILDEIFDETNFRNEIILPRPFTKNLQQQFREISTLNTRHDTLLCYSKNTETKFRPLWVNKETIVHPEGHWHHFWSTADRPTMRYELFGITPKNGQWVWGKKKGYEAVLNYERYLREGQPRGLSLVEYWIETEKRLRFVRKDEEGKPQYWRAPADQVLADTLWLNVLTYENQKIYATQKHEDLLARVINGYSSEGDIVLDAFAGSGTTPAVAEKLKRRWIAIDCGKFAIYTIQKRLITLSKGVGSAKSDTRNETQRVSDFESHLNGAPGILLVTDKARKGECTITLDLLEDLAELIKKHDLTKKDTPLSLVCPESKMQIPASHLEEPEEETEPGQKHIKIKGVRFVISFIEPRRKQEKETSLNAKRFAVLNAGIYDNEAVKQMPWEEYRPFVLKLFQVREREHFIKGFRCDGYVGVHSAFVWNYPEHKKLTIDYDYVKSIHATMSGSGGEKFFIIAPIVSMGFAEDEYPMGRTTYVFLKVPISILMRLLQSGEIGALKQPTKEADVNEVINAVGFDFISQPEAQWKCKKEHSPDAPLLKDYVIHLTEFRSKTLATDPEDFANFETFSMAMVDTDYDGQIFKLSNVFWAHDLVAAELKRLKQDKKAEKVTEEGEEEDDPQAVDLKICEQLSLRIPEKEFKGKQLMLILCDRYGNEKKLVFKKRKFR
jgi:site-specific DNA-methyltransferase (adenine-specific)/adenine-specific DNA-methyltransferase